MPTPFSAQSDVGLIGGSLIGGRYQMERRLAAGGFGQTFVARDLHLPGQPACVIKQLKPRFSDPSLLQTALRLFDREASALYDLGEHAQIPRLLAHFEEGQQFYLAQELIEGAPLSDLVMVGQPWEEMAAIALLQDILQVLSFVHQQGAIHRDIKPDNLLWRDRDERIVMIDFGAVKLVEQQISSLSQPPAKNKLSSLTVAIGTPGYMPIEQLSGKPRFSSDIYSTGMVVIQAVTGLSTGQLFPDDDTGEIEWRSHAPHISDRFAKVLTKMIRYDFRQRYTDASDALEAVHKLPQRTLSAVKRSGYLPAVSSQDAEESKPTPPKLPPTQPPTGPRVSIRERLLSFGSAGKALLPVMPSATAKIVVITLLGLGSSFFAMQWGTRSNWEDALLQQSNRTEKDLASTPSEPSRPAPTPSPTPTPDPTPTFDPASEPEEFSPEWVAELEGKIANATRQDAIDITAAMLAEEAFEDVLMTLEVFDGRWPNDPTLALYKGQSLNGLTRHEEALTVLGTAISTHPDNRALSRERVLALTGLSRQSNSSSTQQQYLDEAADELNKEFEAITAEQSNYSDTKNQYLLEVLDEFQKEIETITAEQSSDSTKNRYLAEAIEKFVPELQAIIDED